jgi:hypothetical protein
VPAEASVEAADDLWAVIARIEWWLRMQDYAGHDPYDLLNARRLSPFCRDTARRRQLVLQLGKRSPLNLRPLLGVPRQKIGKALALIASGYAELQRLKRDPSVDSFAGSLFVELEAKRLSTGDKASWGYEFDVQTRWAFYPRGTPNIIATTFVANAFLDWYQLTGDESLLLTACAAVRSLNDDLLCDDGAESFYAYVPGSRVLIHNANILGCALTARVARLTGEGALAGAARDTATSTLAAQGSDGMWPYGRGAGLQWVDGFHTGYILDGLAELRAAGRDSDLEHALRRGSEAYVGRFFTPKGEPKYSPSSLYPIDIHCASTAVDVLSRRALTDESSLGLARRVCEWTLENMWDPHGFFYFQRHRFYTNRIPYVRWSQAHMFRALTSLLVALEAGQE